MPVYAVGFVTGPRFGPFAFFWHLGGEHCHRIHQICNLQFHDNVIDFITLSSMLDVID